MEREYTIITIIAVASILAIGVSGWTGFSLGRQKAPEVNLGSSSGSDLWAIEPVIWDNPEAPMASGALKESEVPRKAIKIQVTSIGFDPNVFEVKIGQEVVLAVSNDDVWVHTFHFKDAKLSEIAISLNPQETRAITFYAPKQKAEYEFYCAMPGHYDLGEKGAMVVR